MIKYGTSETFKFYVLRKHIYLRLNSSIVIYSYIII